MESQIEQEKINKTARLLVLLAGLCIGIFGLFFLIMDLLNRFEGSLSLGVVLVLMAVPFFKIAFTGNIAKPKLE